MINPLQRAFGWDISNDLGRDRGQHHTCSGPTGPFLAGMIQTFGLKRTQLGP